ncbi:hypothetical protein BD289DRAFT_398920 [Coniella lustricola]|uniref:Uncharacterized protein n=1 Tax=Coniella lustricola TaxID=2025994 RepID=A0A2T2ZTI6_9PEZI|nr:hypothetical protein BD289DRAFT_398920 [Coniella lustricola]
MSTPSIRPAFSAGRSLLEASMRSTARTSAAATTPAQAIRCFSATPVQNNIITFSRSSNETLDSILKELTEKVILPSHLPTPQRKKLFRSRWKQKLESDPIEIELDDLRIRLRHINAAGGEVPAARRALYQAMDNMHTAHDWRKLPGLLEALYFNASRRFLPTDWPKIIRKASAAGQLAVIFEALKRPTRTGLKLDSSETVQELMSAIVWQAGHDGKWSASATERAFRNAERVVQALEEDEHQLRGDAKALWEQTNRFPLKRDPQVLAIPVLFASVMVVKHKGGEVYRKKLRDYVDVLLKQWPENQGLLDLHPHEAYIDPTGVAYLMEKNKFLVAASPILRGLDLAIEAVGGASSMLGQKLALRRKPVRAEVTAALQAGETKGKRGAAVYETVFAEPQGQQAKNKTA